MIKIIQPGFFTTIQDQGRFGYRHLGVPVSGFMDRMNANLANALIGNSSDDAVLEIALGGLELRFEIPTIVCVTGADFQASLNNVSVGLNQSLTINSGDVIRFKHPIAGMFGYLAVTAGIQTERVLGSRSFCPGITPLQRLHKDDELKIQPLLQSAQNDCHREAPRTSELAPNQLITATIDVFPGPEFDLLSPVQQSEFFDRQYTLSRDCNRMGYRLSEPLTHGLPSITTSSVQPGTIQLTSGGQLIVLMRDCQVTGGYARVGQLSETSICHFAQQPPGSTIGFRQVR